MNQQAKFNDLCSVAGGVPSETNALLKSGLDGLDTLIANTEDKADLLDVRSAFQAAAVSNSKCGLKIQDIKNYGDTDIYKTAPEPTHLKPGQVVTDVAVAEEVVYTGKWDPSLMNRDNKAYVANNEGKFSDKWGQTFSGPIVWGNAPGEPYDQGTLMAEPHDPIVKDAKGKVAYDLSKA